MSKYLNIVRDIREMSKKRVPNLKSGMLAGHLCRPLSPYLSAIFIKNQWTPNMVTLLMILFGICGSIFFAIPNMPCKIIGYICFYLWFTMDLCDGEVAHITKNYSKYGKEMDYMAHLICHPLMNIAIWLTYYQMNKYDDFLLTLVFLIFISFELIMRNLIAFNNCLDNKERKKLKSSYVKYFILQAYQYPNFIIVFVPILIIGCYFNYSTLGILLLWLCMDLLVFIMILIRTLVKFYRCK